MSDKALYDATNLDESSETLLVDLCRNFTKIVANNPGMCLNDLELGLANLILALDKSLENNSKLENLAAALKIEVATLEESFQKEKQHRLFELNNSFNVQDVFTEEKDNILKENVVLKNSLSSVKTSLDNLTNDFKSLQLKISEKESIILDLNDRVENCLKSRSEAFKLVSNMEIQLKEANEKSWLNSRWLDDKILDCYFQTFSSSYTEEMCKPLFLGPTVSQLIKHGDSDIVNSMLNELVRTPGKLNFREWYLSFAGKDERMSKESVVDCGRLVTSFDPIVVSERSSEDDCNLVNSSSSLSCKSLENAPAQSEIQSKWHLVKPRRRRNPRSTVENSNKQNSINCENRYLALSEPLLSENKNKQAVKTSCGNWWVKRKSYIKNVQTGSYKKVSFHGNRELRSKHKQNVNSSSSKQHLPKYERSIGSLAGALVIGDSLLKFSGKRCADNGATVDVNPGAKIFNIKKKIINYVQVKPKCIFFHVGTNDLVNGYNGGPGYSGGWGKRAVLHSMADLLSVTRRSFPDTRVVVGGILPRRDINPYALSSLNDQLSLMCSNFGVEFVVSHHRFVGYHHLARDGRHLNRIGSRNLGNFIFQNLVQDASGVREPAPSALNLSICVGETPLANNNVSSGSSAGPELYSEIGDTDSVDRVQARPSGNESSRRPCFQG
ncbi:hypothetical protein J6590_076019 [Homalodisca vitripennis]|nr:hypothetical protein J6590_076019 [Homalodisca vitripennis]